MSKSKDKSKDKSSKHDEKRGKEREAEAHVSPAEPAAEADDGPPVLLVEHGDGITTLTLNRPEAMNALSHRLRRALIATFQALENDRDTRVVILTGAGERAFSAGLDLKELSQGEGARAIGSGGGDGGDLVELMEDFDRPIIGAINGAAITGGFELALACDILIGSTNARFADTHARVGIMPGWGLSQRLSRTIGIYRAKELSLTGNFLSAEQAERWGLLNRVVEPEALMSTCRELAKDILSCDPTMVPAYNQLIDYGWERTYKKGRKREVEVSREHARSVTPDRIAGNREKVMARGREQKGEE